MREARPLVMKQIQTPDATKLFGGAKYHYLSAGWRYATADHDIYMTLHQVRHGIASILINEPGAFARVAKVAKLMVDGGDRPLTDGATHYHTKNVNPSWASRFPRTATIGVHYFYRQPTRSASN